MCINFFNFNSLNTFSLHCYCSLLRFKEMYKRRKYNNRNKNYYENYFRKKYTFKNNKEYTLPEEMFESERWIISYLQDLKKDMNRVKSLLSKYDLNTWSKHTAFRDPSSSIIKTIADKIRPELLTQVIHIFLN